jgi:hypothetical protein
MLLPTARDLKYSCTEVNQFSRAAEEGMSQAYRLGRIALLRGGATDRSKSQEFSS